MINNKLYIVTHNELSSGFQAAQIAHAIADFSKHHTAEFLEWHNNSNYIVILETKNLAELQELTIKANQQNFQIITVEEPDIADELTVMLFIPNENNRKFLANLPCLGKNDKKQEIIKERKNNHLLTQMVAKPTNYVKEQTNYGY